MLKRKRSSDKYVSQALSSAFIPAALHLRAPAGVALFVVAVFFAYRPSINGGFILDDDRLLTDNALIKAPDGLYRFWCTTKSDDYWPVTYTALWVEWRLWAMYPTGYHVTNLILHIAEALLIWIILRKLSIPGAFLAAMIFAVHPVNVESVAWIAQRKNTMAMLFFLLSILWYIKAAMPTASADMAPVRSHGGPWERDKNHSLLSTLHSPLWYWLSLTAFVLAMLGKGSAVVLPVLLLGIIWWLRPLTRRDLVRTAPFFLVAAVLSMVNVWFQTHGSGEVLRIASFLERVLGAGGVLWFYLYKAIFPIDLAFVYPQWHIAAGNPLWWLPLLASLMVTAVLWRYKATWSRPFLFAWVFFCVALLPVMGFTDVGFMKYSLVADHYQHIAIIGMIALVSAGWSAWHRLACSGMPWLATLIAVAAAVAFTFLTYRQNEIYRDAVTLYQAALEKNPGFWMGRGNLASVLYKAGRTEDAVEQYEKAVALNPDYFEAHNNLGAILVQIGRPEQAIEHCMKVVLLKPNYAEPHYNLGNAYKAAGLYPHAIEAYGQALHLKPDLIEAYFNLALVYAEIHKSSEAIDAGQKALELARSKNQTAMAKKIEDWLNNYRASLLDNPNMPSSSQTAPPLP
ncbi:MAG: tetratricopeptide repeat protein [Thermoguttaceae bacterium]|jgi:tetratricopeptide (TPR) repeat protein